MPLDNALFNSQLTASRPVQSHLRCFFLGIDSIYIMNQAASENIDSNQLAAQGLSGKPHTYFESLVN